MGRQPCSGAAVMSWVKADLEAPWLVNHLRRRPRRPQEGTVPLVTAGSGAVLPAGLLIIRGSPAGRKSTEPPWLSEYLPRALLPEWCGCGEVDRARVAPRRPALRLGSQRWWTRADHREPRAPEKRRGERGRSGMPRRPIHCLAGGPCVPQQAAGPPREVHACSTLEEPVRQEPQAINAKYGLTKAPFE